MEREISAMRDKEAELERTLSQIPLAEKRAEIEKLKQEAESGERKKQMKECDQTNFYLSSTGFTHFLQALKTASDTCLVLHIEYLISLKETSMTSV